MWPIPPSKQEYLPANFGRLSRLRILELRENQLNTLPKSIARLTALQRLDIGQNDFSELVGVLVYFPQHYYQFILLLWTNK